MGQIWTRTESFSIYWPQNLGLIIEFANFLHISYILCDYAFVGLCNGHL